VGARCEAKAWGPAARLLPADSGGHEGRARGTRDVDALHGPRRGEGMSCECVSHEKQRAWLALRGAVLSVPIMLRAALMRPEGRAEAVRVARVVHQLHAEAVGELGEYEGEELVGATLQYVRDRIVDVYGQAAWEEAAELQDRKV